MIGIMSIAIREERDVVLARQRTRAVAELIGFDRHEQIRIATAVSEIARNAFVYAGGGRADIAIAGATAPQMLVLTVRDRGPGIADLDAVLAGTYRSTTGMGAGLVGARRLMDAFDIDTSKDGTTVQLKKLLPRGKTLGAAEIARIAEELARQRPAGPIDELQRQNQELLGSLDELRRRQVELVELNRELEDTNRGVVALYAELDERADHLRRADELKQRFLSNMSHEFRTPLHSILALARLLQDCVDGPLNSEQRKQVAFIDKGARELLALVDDMLDLAKVAAGRIDVRPSTFRVEDLFGALRGMLRPLLINDRLQLVFDADLALELHTDEAKVSQILRNLISNALKFTEAGEVRVAARVEMACPEDAAPSITFTVTDSGIGIAREDFARIFEEFGQLDGPVQRRVKGTGLGLPLSQKLARLLGGRIDVDSTLGVGSTFSLRIPARYAPETPVAGTTAVDPALLPVLVVEDDQIERFLIEKSLRNTRFQPLFASSTREARACLGGLAPAAVLLDVVLTAEEVWPLLGELRAQERTRDVPILVVTQVDAEAKALGLGADAFVRKPCNHAELPDQLARLISAREKTRSAR